MTMMISPESYYEMYLKDKNANQIMTAIRGIKKEIGRLKNIMGDPSYDENEMMICPSHRTVLSFTRLYLERAKAAYIEAGGVYTPSKQEKKVFDFDENIDYIARITFSIGGYFGGYETRIFTLDERNVHRHVEHALDTVIKFQPNFRKSDEKFIAKEEFLEGIREIHMGEWLRHYSPNYLVCDGTNWGITIEYNNGHKKVQFSGNNAYPYNFDMLQNLVGIAIDLGMKR